MNRQETEVFINQTFTNIAQDYPWEDFPDYTIFRHADTRKWFALITRIKYSTFIPNRPGEVDFINLKSDPDLIETLLKKPGFFPAYHMNKTHWFTILLDGSVPAPEIQPLIAMSFALTNKPSPKPPQNMLQ